MSSNLDGTRRIDGVRHSRETGGARRGVIARRLWPMLAAAGLMAAVLGQACSSDSGTKNTSTTPGASVQTTPAAATPATATQTPVDPVSLSYVADTGPKNSYRIDIPSGWEHEDPVGPGGYMRRYFFAVGDVRQVAITVRCENGRSIDDMMNEDNLAVGGRRGQYGIGAAPTVTIAALNGRAVDYDVSPGGSTVEAHTIYLASNPCGWRIVLQAYSLGGRDRWMPLFEKVAQSFQEISSPPSG